MVHILRLVGIYPVQVKSIIINLLQNAIEILRTNNEIEFISIS